MDPLDALQAEVALPGADPMLVFDVGRITRSIDRMARGLGHPGRVLAAVKSFPAPEVLAAARSRGTGFEVSALSEYDLLPDDLTGVTVSLNAPAPDRLERYLTRGNRLLVHLDDAQRARSLDVPVAAHLGVRVNASALRKAAGTTEGEPRHSRFGVDLDGLAAAAPLFRDGCLRGIHMHDGSEQNTPEVYRGALEQLLEAVDRLGFRPEWIDLGGGLHGVPEGAIESLLASLTRMAGDIPVLVEPGRVMSMDSGRLLARVLSVREVAPGQWLVTVNASYQCHARWQHLEWAGAPEFGATRLSFSDEAPPVPGCTRVSFVSATCIELDHLCVYELPVPTRPPIEVGDVVVFRDIDGYAYGWNTGFNGVPRAAVRFLWPTGEDPGSGPPIHDRARPHGA